MMIDMIPNINEIIVILKINETDGFGCFQFELNKISNQFALLIFKFA